MFTAQTYPKPCERQTSSFVPFPVGFVCFSFFFPPLVMSLESASGFSRGSHSLVMVPSEMVRLLRGLRGSHSRQLPRPWQSRDESPCLWPVQRLRGQPAPAPAGDVASGSTCTGSPVPGSPAGPILTGRAARAGGWQGDLALRRTSSGRGQHRRRCGQEVFPHGQRWGRR